MSSSPQASPSSTPNFQPIFEKALKEYKKKTGKDLTAHPLAAEIKSCDSPDAILTVLEGKANELNQSRSSDDRLTKWLNPTVNILNALSAILGEGAGSVFPPTKIIFSGIGILLLAATSTAADHDMLVKLFNRIERFFKRLKIYINVPPSPAVTDELSKIIAEVLSILAIVTKIMKEGRIKRFLRKLAGMNYLEDALQRFDKLEQRELLTGIAQVYGDFNVLKHDAKEMKGEVKEIAIKMGARDLEEALQKLKGWLSPPDPSTNYNIGLRDLHEETTTWFLEDHIFREWYSTGYLLWIHGKPGSGKSILCSAIIQRIISLCHGGRASVAYFYFDFRDENKKHRHNLLSSLLIQFAAHSIACRDIISHVYLAHGRGTQQPSDDVLIKCLTDTLSAMTQHPIYVILDALDECPDTTGVRTPRERVLSLIYDLVNLCLPNLHICVTSRPEVDIRNRLEPLLDSLPVTSRRVSLLDQTGHREDITKYIRSEVDFIANDKSWSEDDKELVIETLSEKADGMFRWVFCQLEMLRLCLPSSVRHFLNDLPKTLDETYERILKGIPDANRSHAQRLLQCLAVAIRPLRVDELAEILISDTDATEKEFPRSWYRSNAKEQELLSACSGLVTIANSDDSRVVQFSHFSVQEFLTSNRLSTSSEDISCYHILPDDAHTTLAQASLRVLLRLGDHVTKYSAKEIPLAEYAARYWVSHAQVGNVSSRVMLQMKTLFDSVKFKVWVEIYNIDSDKPYSRNLSLQTALSSGAVYYSKAIYYSALCGFYDLVKYFVEKHPRVVNNFGGTHEYPLVAALHGGDLRVAELLLQHGADVKTRGLFGRSPLHSAIGWSDDVAAGAVRFLLRHGADANAQEDDYSTPLHQAAAQGYFEVAQMILQHRADQGADVNSDINSKNCIGETPMHLASKHTFPRSEDDRLNLVQLLLKHGAKVDSRDVDNATALHNASLMRGLEVARMLLNHGASVNAKDNQSRTPLHQLLEAGDYSDADHFGIVSKKRKKEDRFDVAQLLIQHGADVNARDKDHETPLHLAAYLEVRLARMLLDHGANASVNAKDSQGRTPLHRVLWAEDYPAADRFGVAQLLIRCGANVNAREKDRETPLHLASRLLSLEESWILLEYGADINAENHEGKIPFQLAQESIREETKQWPSDSSIGRSQRAECVALLGLLYGG